MTIIMKILFVHQNFPGQFRHLAPELAARGHEVTAMTMRKVEELTWEGVRLIPYKAGRSSSPTVHPWVNDIETKVIRGEAAFRKAFDMKQGGYCPDVVVAHPGWGESLFLKDVWPRVRLGLYCEYYYRTEGADFNFDPEFRKDDPGKVCRLRLKNISNMLHEEIADAGISPTAWQAGSYPQPFRNKISVIHDGIDTGIVVPDSSAGMRLNSAGGEVSITGNDEVITFVNRNLEPYRGYHIFMRALPELLRRRPKARVMIVGGSNVSYGAKPPDGKTWKQIFSDEVRGSISDADWSRVHFLGNIRYEYFLTLLQLSTVHVYLTYPFVLSWSLLEAMSAGCAIVGSDTAPVREVVQNGETGILVDFFDRSALVERVCSLLDDPKRRETLGKAARAFAIERYDLHTVCLPRQIEWIGELVAR